MADAGDDLLERMRHSKAGWRYNDLESVYIANGFTIRHGKEAVAKHPRYPQLRATFPKHGSLAKAYVVRAIKLIDELRRIEKEQADQ